VVGSNFRPATAKIIWSQIRNYFPPPPQKSPLLTFEVRNFSNGRLAVKGGVSFATTIRFFLPNLKFEFED
jgi:hypothetical protein